MPRDSERGGPETRRRIAGVASRMFLERGYDAVTVAEVAREVGVSSVTVFKHFPRKEDLFLDRTSDVADLLHSAVRDRAAGKDVVTALRELAFGLLDERHAFAGVSADSAQFLRTVADAPALIARAREIADDLQRALAKDLADDPDFDGDAQLLAAFFMGGYTSAFVQSAADLLAGKTAPAIVKAQRARFIRLFAALERAAP